MNIFGLIEGETVFTEGEDIDPKEKLVFYRGGGFEGNFWEPNFLFVDKEGEIINIASTGYKGCFPEEGFSPDRFQKYVMEGESTLWYDPKNKDHMLLFCDGIASAYTSVAYEFLWEHDDKDWQIAYQCGCQGCTNIQDTRPEGELKYYTIDLESFGGIASGTYEWACEECYNTRGCSNCGEIDTRDPKSYPMFREPHGGDMCMECTEAHCHNNYDHLMPGSGVVFDKEYRLDAEYAAQMTDAELEGKLEELDKKLETYHDDEQLMYDDYVQYVHLSYDQHFLWYEKIERKEKCACVKS